MVLLKIKNTTKQLTSIQSQLTASELLNADLQVNFSQLHCQIEAIKQQLNESDTENSQVSKQLEHRIKLLQEETKLLEEQFSKLNEQQAQDKFYTRANKLAALGADVEEIMKECELPRAEVEMLLAIHKK